MDPLDLMQSFVERCNRSASVAEITRAFQASLEQMGFRYFACCSHVNPGDPPQDAVVLHNYPTTWARSYAARNLHELDPVFLRAERTILPFFWDAPDFRGSLSLPQRLILLEAATAGLVHGFTVPIHTPWTARSHRASCSVVSDSPNISARAYCAVQVMSMYLYDSVRDRNAMDMASNPSSRVDGVLSARERQCLEFVARGKSDWEISRLVCISQHTVHKHIEAAKRKLGVSTRVQAVVWAIQRREISLGDVVKADPLRKNAAEGDANSPSEEQPRAALRGE